MKGGVEKKWKEPNTMRSVAAQKVVSCQPQLPFLQNRNHLGSLFSFHMWNKPKPTTAIINIVPIPAGQGCQ